MTGGDDIVTDRAKLDGTVPATVVEHLRGEKLKVFTFKPKRGFKKTRGHRSELTQDLDRVDRRRAGQAEAGGHAQEGSRPLPPQAATEKETPDDGA